MGFLRAAGAEPAGGGGAFPPADGGRDVGGGTPPAEGGLAIGGGGPRVGGKPAWADAERNWPERCRSFRSPEVRARFSGGGGGASGLKDGARIGIGGGASDM